MGFAPSTMKVKSPAFGDGERIPRKHTGEGKNVSPPLEWKRPPEETKAFAVICHDPDAPLITPFGQYGYVHWVLYGIPGSVTSLEKGTTGFVAGLNQTGEPGWTGPMPPEGHGVHHYFFWVLALDTPLDLPPGLTQTDLLARVEPHVLGMSRLVGTYQRK